MPSHPRRLDAGRDDPATQTQIVPETTSLLPESGSVVHLIRGGGAVRACFFLRRVHPNESRRRDGERLRANVIKRVNVAIPNVGMCGQLYAAGLIGATHARVNGVSNFMYLDLDGSKRRRHGDLLGCREVRFN